MFRLPTLPRAVSALTPSSALRQFSTTSNLATKTISVANIPSAFAPPYPYGERLIYKQSNHGLYGLSRIRFGNHVSPGRNPHKHRRTWKPNVHLKRMWSKSLGVWVKTRMTIRVFRTILKDKEGGLDAYIMKDTAQRLKELGPGGWKLRWLIQQSAALREAWAAERRALGLPDVPAEEKAAADKEAAEMVQISLDYATMGALSRTTRELLAERELRMEQEKNEEFAIGDAGELEGATDGDYEKEILSPSDGVVKTA